MVKDNALFNGILENAGVSGEMVKATASPQCYLWHYILYNPNDILKVRRCVPALSAVNGAPVAVVPSKLGHFALSISRENERFFPRALNYSPTKCNGDMFIGIDEDGEPVVKNLKQTKSILIAGSTGGGKSVALSSIIMSLARSSVQAVHIVLIDLKKVEFSLYEDLPHLITPPISEPLEAVEMLRNVLSEINRRYSQMEQMHRRSMSFEEMNALVVFIDEYAELVTSGNVNKKEVENLVSRIAATGRACNVFLVISTQHPVKEIISNAIKVNLPSKIGLRTANTAQSVTIIGSRDCCDLLGKGDAIISIDGEQPQRVQVPYLSDEDIDYLFSDIRAAKANSKNKKRKKSRNGGGVNVLQILFQHIYLIIRAFVRGLFGKGI